MPRRMAHVMDLTARPTFETLPVDRAFMVQLRADADLQRGAVRGRVEHVSSGTAARFESLEQLVDWMREAMARREHDRGHAASGPDAPSDDPI